MAQKEEEDEIDESEITEGNFPKVNCLFIQLLLFHVLFTRFLFLNFYDGGHQSFMLVSMSYMVHLCFNSRERI